MAIPSGTPKRVRGPQFAAAKRPGAKSPKLETNGLNNLLTTEQREARFRKMFERSNDAIQLVSAEGVILYSSESTHNVIGYTPDQIRGVTVEPYLHPDDVDEFKREWQNMLATPERSVTLQYRVRHQNGEWVWVETTLTNHMQTADIHAVVKNFKNITKRKQAEQALQDSEARWRFMAESMPVLIFSVNTEGRVDYCNSQWEEYAGVPIKEMMVDDEAQDKLLHPDDKAPFWAAWKKAFKSGEPLEFQYRLRRKDGVYRWFICRMRPMKRPDGSIELWLGSCTDIDDLQNAMRGRHELELQAAALETQRRELLAINRAKDEFISLASHQLRTPATGVKQYLGMLLQGFAGPINEDQKAFLQTAYESNDRQISIVNDLLQVARIDAGKIKLHTRRTNVVKLIKSVMNEHAGDIAERGQQIALKTQADAIKARVDADRICMVLDNIIDNASKYTPPDRTITVSVARDEATGKVTISVTDQGIGMTAAEASKIFNKFSRLESPLTKSVDGSGLGLYWAKKIVELHGGAIAVKSRQGRGTTFIISLPA